MDCGLAEMLIDDSDDSCPGFIRRPRRLTRTRHLDIRNFLSNMGRSLH